MDSDVQEAFEAILLSSWGAPRHAGTGYVNPSLAVLNIKHLDQRAIELAFNELVQQGYLIPSNVKDSFKVSRKFVEKREALLHEKRLVKSPLLNQRKFDPSYLIIAIGFDVMVTNKRIVGPYLAATEITSFEQIKIHLFDFSAQEIEDAIKDLETKRYIKRDKISFLGVEEPGFSITVEGRVFYERTVMPALGLQRDASILDKVKDDDFITIFWAWQSEYKTSRNQIKGVLEDVEESLNKTLNLIRPLKVIQATEIGEGAIHISADLIEKIKRADLFVGDLTPVLKFNNRLYPSSNVLIETGYALASKEANQVYLVESKREQDQIPGEGSLNCHFPFDLYVVQRVLFSEPKQLKERLLADFKVALDRLGKILHK